MSQESTAVIDGEQQDPERRPGGRIAAGLIVITVGIGMLLDRLEVSDVRITGRLWPFVLLILGAVRIAVPPGGRHRPRSRLGAGWLVIVGLWGLVSEYHWFGLDYDRSWPLLIIGAGLMLVLRASVVSRERPRDPTETH
jgi:hypothetical protein